MAVLTKPTVRFKGFTFPLLTILDTLVWLDSHPIKGQDTDLVITSANDSTHLPTSKHYTNEALDIRCKTMPDDVVTQIADRLRQELGDHFTVLWEDRGTPNAHLHIQKRKGT